MNNLGQHSAGILIYFSAIFISASFLFYSIIPKEIALFVIIAFSLIAAIILESQASLLLSGLQC